VLDHYDAPFAVSANARSVYELRAPRELRALGEAVGFAGETVEAGLREWGRVAERNRDRLSDSFVAPGVRRGRYESDAEQERGATDGCDEDGDRA
jgi:ribonuclease P/MRP protein subunit RPP1